MRTETEHTVYLNDYAPPAYTITDVSLRVEIMPQTSKVFAQLTIVPADGTMAGTPLVLDGDELSVKSVAIDAAPLFESDYEATAQSLTIANPPLRRFVLDTEVELNPEGNTRLMGLYRSNGVWCTQCEPEGFRRITYFIDRPDILARYTVKMIASKSEAPVLLANGNRVEAGDYDEGRHYAVWHDPFPKPSYLFAMVAGDLAAVRDSFTTASGRTVELGIYCEHGKEDQCGYAMAALKRSMAWDERRFGREYDLDVFNIVAVSDFNFGAMENKGLNIFNDRLVFARPETATDGDFAAIESVIAHEYFHNWTGNRITCRDWFQLCLKEGLTVYRDQEFSMDERSRPVGRIEDVRALRAAQFPEDASPLAHPARPDRYKEINNFYTATVYEKGAEIVRMLATLLGREGFRAGTDLYFDRHDGEATTIEAWLKVFEDASGRDLGQFGQWYLQAGTPTVTVTDSYDAASKTYRLKLSQATAPTQGQTDKHPMVLPIKFGLVGPNGSEMQWTRASGAPVDGDMMVMTGAEAEVVFEGIANRPIPSLFREFSAPVKVVSSASRDDLLFLARHDSDPFNRWQALEDVATRLIVEAVKGGNAIPAAAIEALAMALADTLGAKDLDPAFKAHALSPPPEMAIARALASDVDPDRIHAVRAALIEGIVAHLGGALGTAHRSGDRSQPYSPDAAQSGERSLRNAALRLLAVGRSAGADGLVAEQYRSATNMTDRLAALSAAVAAWVPQASALLDDFRRRYAGDPLVFDKWLSLTAAAPDAGVVDRMAAILADPAFPKNNPNRLRSLVGTFAAANPVQFARRDGMGFRFVADFVADVDARNPQVASRVLTGFRVWQSFEPVRRAAAGEALQRLRQREGLSRNVAEILERTLGEAS